MSRSIHSTIRAPQDPGDRARKRLIKRLVGTERAAPRVPTPSLPARAIPIALRDRGPFVHYPASPDDLRGLLARLPAGSADGVASVELVLDERARERHGRVDPFVGRLPYEILPGVFSGPVLGSYHADGARITLHGYVYDPSMPHSRVVATYLRFRMLCTFVHELGHHQDYASRIARGRWRAESPNLREMHAESVEHAWARAYVLPYLEETYPEDMCAFDAWMSEHGGAAVPLDVLCGDPRQTDRDGPGFVLFSARGAFRSLLEAVRSGGASRTTWCDFANDLHYAERYVEAHAILARLLAEDPEDERARALLGDILVHEERLVEAEAVACALVTRPSAAAEGWTILRDAARQRGDWARVVETTERLLALADGAPDLHRDWNNRLLQLRARIELGHEVEAELAGLAGRAPLARVERDLKHLRCLLLVRRGEHEAALALTNEAIAEDFHDPPRAELEATRLDAMQHLERPCSGLSNGARRTLRQVGYAAWALRLDAVDARKARIARASESVACRRTRA